MIQVRLVALLIVLLAAPASAVTVVAPPTVVVETRGPQTEPVVAPLGGGGYVVVFVDGSVDDGFTDPPFPIDGVDGDLEGILGQRIDRRGRPIGSSFLLNATTEGRQICPAVAPDPSTGGFVATWFDVSRDRVVVRRFDTAGRPVTGEIVLPTPGSTFCGSAVATREDGTAIVTTRAGTELVAHRVAPNGTATTTDTMPVAITLSVFVHDLVLTDDGGAILVTRVDGGTVRASRLDADGRWVGDFSTSLDAYSSDAAVRPHPDDPSRQELVILTARLGDVVLHRFDIGDLDAAPVSTPIDDDFSWTGLTEIDGDLVLLTARAGDPPGSDSPFHGMLRLRRLAPDLTPVGDPIDTLEIGLGHRFNAPIDMAIQPDGHLLVAWSRDFKGPIDMALFDANEYPTLTLGGRFAVQAYWRDFEGQSDFGIPVPLSEDTGAFWFFDSANLELTVKVLDGRAINGHFWVFNGSMTNVHYDLLVTDKTTGATYFFQNPLGEFGSFGDTEALPGE